MGRREWPLKFKCSHPGCAETVRYSFDTRRDLERSWEAKNYSGGRWKCARHQRPNEVLGPDNLTTRFEVVSDQRDYGRFFGQQGYVSGPGFKVWAKDLPAGTKLIVTAEIVLPEAGATHDR